MVTRSGKKYKKLQMAEQVDIGVLPEVIIERIAYHLIQMSEFKFGKVENQLSLNRHWRRAVRNPAHRKDIKICGEPCQCECSWAFFPNLRPLKRFLKSLGPDGLEHLESLALNNISKYMQFESIDNVFRGREFQLKSFQVSNKEYATEYPELDGRMINSASFKDFIPERLQNLECLILRHVLVPEFRSISDGFKKSVFEDLLSITSITKLVLEFTDPDPFIVKLDSLKNLEHLELINHDNDDRWDSKWSIDGTTTIDVSVLNPKKLKYLILVEVNLVIAKDEQFLNRGNNDDCIFSKLEVLSIRNMFSKNHIQPRIPYDYATINTASIDAVRYLLEQATAIKSIKIENGLDTTEYDYNQIINIIGDIQLRPELQSITLGGWDHWGKQLNRDEFQLVLEALDNPIDRDDVDDDDFDEDDFDDDHLMWPNDEADFDDDSDDNDSDEDDGYVNFVNYPINVDEEIQLINNRLRIVFQLGRRI